MATNYETPIENFLEKATLPKPVPPPRAPPRVIEKLPRKSRAKTKPPPPAAQSADGTAPPESSSITTPIVNEVKRAEPRKKRPAKELGNEAETTASPKQKKQKVTQQPKIVLDEPTTQLLTQERETCFLSMIKASQGVLEIDLKFDELYKSHVEQNFPEAQPNVDYKTLVGTLDILESRGEVERIMLSVGTITGRKLYKSVLILPGLDLETNERIRELKEELQHEGLSYKPEPLEELMKIGTVGEGDGGDGPPDMTVEVAKTVPRQRDLAPIPTAMPPKVKSKNEKKTKKSSSTKREKIPKQQFINLTLSDDDIPPEFPEGIPRPPHRCTPTL